jgi:hypothetical protein
MGAPSVTALPHSPHADASALARELHAAGHLPAPEWPPAADTPTPVSHWISALQIAGGWLAAVFLMAFLGAGAMPFIRSATGWLVIGVLLSAGAGLALTRIESGFVRQFLFAIALAGHGALIVGIFMLKDNHGDMTLTVSALALALYEAALLAWIAWPPHRLVAALMCCGALALALHLAVPEEFRTPERSGWWFGFYWLAACLLWLREPRWLPGRHAQAIMALACALGLYGLGYVLFQRLAHGIFHTAGFITAPALAAVNAITIVLLARGLPRDARHLGAIALLLAALALTWKAPLVGMGGVALALGFARGRAWLAWIGGAALVYGIGQFYYDLNLSLLHKSALMALGGGLLLVVRALIARGEPA